MAERIMFTRSVKYAGDVHTELLKAGWDLETATLFVNSIPAADVAPVVHGLWMEMIESKLDTHTGEYWEEVYYNCLNCDYAADSKTPYCPNCGAIMDGE